MDDHLACLMLYAKDNMQHVFRTSIGLRGWQLARDWKSHISVKSISSTMGWKY